MIPLLLAAGRTALAAGRVSSAVSAAKGVTTALKNRGYISDGGSAAKQIARAFRARQGSSSAFRNPYRFANNPGEQAAAATDMGSSVEEKTQTQSNTKKQTLIISADNVFLRTSKAIMDSVMPEAPQNIERASGTDEPTPEKMKEPPSKSKIDSMLLLGVVIGKALGAIIKKLKDLLDPLFKLFAKGLAFVYRGLAKVTFGSLSEAYTSTADTLDAYAEGPTAPDEAPAATTPGMTPASEPTTIATDYTPAVTPTSAASPTSPLSSASPTSPLSSASPTSPTSPKSAYAAPSGFFGAPTLGTTTTTAPSGPAIVTNNTAQSLFTKMDDKKTSGKNTSNISAISSSDDINEAITYFKDAEKIVLTPYWDYNHWRIGLGSDTYVDTDGKQKKVGGKDGKNKSIKPNLKITKEQAYADVKLRLEREFKPGVVKSLGADNYNKLSPKQQAALLSYAYNTGVGSSKSGTGFGGLIKKGLREAIQSGDTLSASNIISKGIITATDTSTGKRVVVKALVKRRKEEAEMFKQDTINLKSPAKMNIKPQSSAGSLSAPTQATGRNIETTSQILNSAPSVTTAQNTQPVVINNINAPTVASGKGSSGPAIEMSLFRNIDNSILANTNRHLRAGILGV